jgi:hypothetical protein
VIATIKKIRPELLSEAIVSAAPIPDEIPQHLNSREVSKEIEDIGEPTSATFFTLSKINPTGWYVSFLLYCFFLLNFAFPLHYFLSLFY